MGVALGEPEEREAAGSSGVGFVRYLPTTPCSVRATQNSTSIPNPPGRRSLVVGVRVLVDKSGLSFPPALGLGVLASLSLGPSSGSGGGDGTK